MPASQSPVSNVCTTIVLNIADGPRSIYTLLTSPLFGNRPEAQPAARECIIELDPESPAGFLLHGDSTVAYPNLAGQKAGKKYSTGASYTFRSSGGTIRDVYLTSKFLLATQDGLIVNIDCEY